MSQILDKNEAHNVSISFRTTETAKRFIDEKVILKEFKNPSAVVNRALFEYMEKDIIFMEDYLELAEKEMKRKRECLSKIKKGKSQQMIKEKKPEMLEEYVLKCEKFFKIKEDIFISSKSGDEQVDYIVGIINSKIKNWGSSFKHKSKINEAGLDIKEFINLCWNIYDYEIER